MDPSHRDRLAFARICSGRFERGMTVECDRTGPRADDEVRHHRVRRRPRDRRGGLPRRRRRARQRHRPEPRRHDLRRRARRRAGHVPADPPLLARGVRHGAPARHRSRQAVPARARAARRGGRRAGPARPRPRRRQHDPRRRRPAAVRGLRPSPGERVQRPGRDPERRLPGDPPHRSTVGRPGSERSAASGSSIAATARSSPCSRTGTAWLASRPTSPSSRSNRSSPGPSRRSESRHARRQATRDRTVFVAVVGDLLPQLRADPGGRGRGQAVDGDDTLDHVGEHGWPRPLPDPHRHDPAARPAPQGAVGADDPWWAAEARGHETASPGLTRQGACGVGEPGRGRGLHATDGAQRGARVSRGRIAPAHAL